MIVDLFVFVHFSARHCGPGRVLGYAGAVHEKGGCVSAGVLSDRHKEL